MIDNTGDIPFCKRSPKEKKIYETLRYLKLEREK